MRANNRKQSSRRTAPANLEGRYGKIGISAMEAAARYSSAGNRTDARSKVQAKSQPNNDASQRRNDPGRALRQRD
jgi:hypothetical protein